MKSPCVYEHIRRQDLIPLPSKRTPLHRLINSIAADFGFLYFALESLEQELADKPIRNRLVVLSFDEMSITQDMTFNAGQHAFTGYGIRSDDENGQMTHLYPTNFQKMNVPLAVQVYLIINYFAFPSHLIILQICSNSVSSEIAALRVHTDQEIADKFKN